MIGVTSQILTGSGSAENGNVGIGFAIPSNTVATFLEQAKTGKLAPDTSAQEQSDPYRQRADPYGQGPDPYGGAVPYGPAWVSASCQREAAASERISSSGGIEWRTRTPPGRTSWAPARGRPAGPRIVSQPPALRRFTARFAPLG